MAFLCPYLNFDGNAEQAMRFYHSILGGEFYIQLMETIPGMDLPENEKKRVMHASITLGEGQLLMASDIIPSAGHKLSVGNNNHVSLHPDSRADADRIFKALSEGGKIDIPMEDMFWGDYYGAFTDRFQTNWMINFNDSTKNAK